MAYGACASDGRSADAWTERAPILRDREGVNLWSGSRGVGIPALTLGDGVLACSRREQRRLVGLRGVFEGPGPWVVRVPERKTNTSTQ